MARLTSGSRAFASPSRYIQGRREIDNLPSHVKVYGSRAFLIIDVFFYDEMSKKFESIFDKGAFLCDKFEGQITNEKIEEVGIRARTFDPEVIVGIGGGKALDMAKAVADDLKLKLIVIPTTASTDAPTSSLSVIYTQEGAHNGTRHYYKNPDLVLLDTDILVKAPIRFLVAGMGDAIATYVEAKANEASDNGNYVNGGYKRTIASMAIAKACYDTIITKGYRAKIEAEKGLCTQDVEDVIEANTLLSGLGFQNTGCAGAHAMNAGFSNLGEDECGRMLHGEFVAFGTLVELVMEQAEDSRIEELLKLFDNVGLPLTLKDLGIDRNNKAALMKVAEKSSKSYWTVEPFFIDVDMIYDAILAADALGSIYKEKGTI